MPEDYGALVLSMIVAGLIQQIGSLGYEIYYLQFKGSEEERYKVLEQIFNLRLLTNTILCLVQIIVGCVLLFVFKEEVSGGIVLLLALSLFVEGFNAPQETILKDTFDFKIITKGNIIKELFASLGKVSGALLGLGGYVFGIGPVIGSLFRYFYYRKSVAYDANYFNWDKKLYTNPLNFGVQNLIGGIGMFLVKQTDKLFLTSYYNTVSVGLYSFAWSNASIINNYLVNPQGQLILSFITKYKPGDKELFFKLSVLRRLFVVIAIPLLILINGFIEPIVMTVFGEKWIGSIPLLKILLVYFSFSLIVSPFQPVLTGLGFPEVNNRLVYSRAVILIPSLFLVSFSEMELSTYLVVFVSINVIFELMKVSVATTKMGLRFSDFILKSKVDLLIVLVAALSAFYQEGLMVFLSIGIMIVLLIIDMVMTKEAILFAKKLVFK